MSLTGCVFCRSSQVLRATFDSEQPGSLWLADRASCSSLLPGPTQGLQSPGRGDREHPLLCKGLEVPLPLNPLWYGVFLGVGLHLYFDNG
jgi:hypothetical protein